ncbi:MAG: TetR/AcrR family transcriptional regulator [Deltaproteobacteria bacterium]|nr:TetR/AcrR family transcriptional regulator [Deltaproteobacteria bacterium]
MARPRKDLRERLLASARALFLRDGVDGASLRAIAKGAGASLGMVYYYFPSKDELFFAVVEDVYAGLLAELSVALKPDATPEARLQRLFLRMAAIDAREVDTLRLVLREMLLSSERLEKLLGRVATGHLPMMLEFVLEARALGKMREAQHPVVQAASSVLLAVVPQLALRRVRASVPELPTPEPEDLARMFLDVLLGGIAARPAQGGGGGMES